MISNCLIIFDDFDPVSNYKLSLLKAAIDVEKSIDKVIFAYANYKQGDRVFQNDEKMALLSACIPNLLSPRYLIDGDSFSNSSWTIGEKLKNIISKNPKSIFFLLLDSSEYLFLEQTNYWSYICATTQIILYVLPEHKEAMHDHAFTSKNLLFINSNKDLDSLKKASIFEVNESNFPSLIIEYMNKSGECGIQRIKAHLSPDRFKHSIRVAGTIKRICEILEVEDAELRYDAYLSAIYHDICKEFAPNIQKEIAKDKLGMDSDLHLNSYHGPIASWYLKNKYLFDNEDILEAISQHTTPSEHPKDITIYLYLADKLEVSKKDRYPEDVYDQIWNLIEQKKHNEAFSFLLNYSESTRNKN